MKKPLALILMTLLLMSVTQAANDIKLRYSTQNQPSKFSVKQSMVIGEKGENHFSRDFSFDVSTAEQQKPESILLTINKARASFSAHGQKMRQQTSHMISQSVALTVSSDGLRILPPSEKKDQAVNVQLVEAGFPVGRAFSELLPILPNKAINIGSRWTSEKKVHSLEGWSWLEGTIANQHTVTSIEQKHGSTLISVETLSKGNLVATAQSRKYQGEEALTQKSNWVFDATHGRLISLSVEQKTKGRSEVPQGMVIVAQTTQFNLSTGE